MDIKIPSSIHQKGIKQLIACHIETMEPQLHYPAVQPTDPDHAVQSPTIGDQLTQQRQQISQKKTMVREITKHNKDRCASTIT